MTPELLALLKRAWPVAHGGGYYDLARELDEAIAAGERELAHRALVHRGDVAKGASDATD